MTKVKLTKATITSQQPTKREHIIWDTQVHGFGLRVQPTGTKTFILQIKIWGKSVKKKIGRVDDMDLVEARANCLEVLLALHRGEYDQDQIQKTGRRGHGTPLFADFVNGIWRNQRFSRWKPTTRASGATYIHSQLEPAFGSLYLNEINRIRVAEWFDRYSKTHPGGANRSLEILHEMMNFAISLGHITVNPAKGITKNPKRTMTRFLGQNEIAQLLSVLDKMEAECRQDRSSFGHGRKGAIDIVRLLLFTGCRHREICNLEWRFLRDDMLMLPDTKTGPRNVYLSEAALAIIHRQNRTGSTFIFPSPVKPESPRANVSHTWRAVQRHITRVGGNFNDVRIHDLRHTFASQAVLQGVNVPMISKLLGHKQIAMTLRYTHIHDADAKAAAERVGTIIDRLLAGRVTAKALGSERQASHEVKRTWVMSE